ncbi:MAG: DAHL domain-containing protein [Burkholderiales bacterium]
MKVPALSVSRPVLLYGTVVTVLIGILMLLVAKTRTVDFETHNEIVNLLRQLKQLDAEWNADVLRSKMGLNIDYDPVASPLPVIEGLEVALAERTRKLDETSTRVRTELNKMLDAHRELIARKTATIEQFKSQNSILRNSLHYLPVAADDLGSGAISAALPAAKRAELETAASGLLSATMTYLHIADAARRERVVALGRALSEGSAQYPADVRERINIYLAHVSTVLRQDDIGKQVLAELAAVPTANSLDTLTDTYAAEHEQLLTGQQRYRGLLIGFSTLLLLLLAYYGWRLVKSYRLLNRTNGDLRQANRLLKESQLQLVQSEKMSALGQMVAGIAHEINTPLAFVKGTLDVVKENLALFDGLAQSSHQVALWLRGSTSDKSVMVRNFDRVEKMAKEAVEEKVIEETTRLLQNGTRGIDQISEIVINLKNFSRLDRARSVEYDVREGLESTIVIAKNVLKNKIVIEREFDEIPAVICAPSQINQVFLNLITNAAQAIASEGRITLRTMMYDKETIRIEVEDDGAGIPPEVLPKIFDPFFTTKEIGKGTGMGLSISYKIIQEHGGRILVDSEPGLGTTFSVLLPLQPSRQPDADEADDWLEAA